MSTSPIDSSSYRAGQGKWKQLVGAARLARGRLSELELLKIESYEHALTGLVYDRPGVTADQSVQFRTLVD